jgi:hypothetical protein
VVREEEKNQIRAKLGRERKKKKR